MFPIHHYHNPQYNHHNPQYNHLPQMTQTTAVFQHNLYKQSRSISISLYPSTCSLHCSSIQTCINYCEIFPLNYILYLTPKHMYCVISPSAYPCSVSDLSPLGNIPRSTFISLYISIYILYLYLYCIYISFNIISDHANSLRLHTMVTAFSFCKYF